MAWNTFLERKATPLFPGYDLELLRDSKKHSIYGIEFSSSDRAGEGNNKITLRYDHRRGKWNYNHESLQQAAKQAGVVVPASWSHSLLNRAGAIVKHQTKRVDDDKRKLNLKLNKNLHLAWKGDFMEEGAIRGYVNGVAKQMQEQKVFEMRTEMEWKQLESVAKDLSGPHGIEASLLVNDALCPDRPYLYCGLELRINSPRSV